MWPRDDDDATNQPYSTQREMAAAHTASPPVTQQPPAAKSAEPPANSLFGVPLPEWLPAPLEPVPFDLPIPIA
jgi:hypothetical protein